MDYIKDSRLSLEIEAVFNDALSEDEGVERMDAMISKGYKLIDARISSLASNRIDDFPGSTRYELCENDGQIDPSETGGWTGSIEIYGEDNWVTEYVARDVKSLFVEVFDTLAEEFGAKSIKVTRVRAIRSVVSRVTETLNV